MNSYNHLSAETAALLDLPDDQRANYMLRDRFITHSCLQELFDYVEFLHSVPKQTRASGLVISGCPGSGKTMFAHAVLRRYPRAPATDVAAATRPVVMISMTGAREAKTLYNRLLVSLDCPAAASVVGSDRELLAMKLCRASGLRLLLVDEIQDILSSTPRQQRITLDTLKFMMNELCIPIVALGTNAAATAMQLDEHLNARFKYRELPVWKPDATLGDFLDTLESRLPLKQRSCLSSPTLMRALVAVSGGTLDALVKTVCYAAAHAVEKGVERVTPELIALATRVPPVAAVRWVNKTAA